MLDLSGGGVWLASDSTGVVAHLHGTVGRADAVITVPGAAGHRLDVVTQGPNLLIADRNLGVVHLVEPQQLTPTRTTATGPDAMVTATGSEIYATVPRTGHVRRLAGNSLATVGPVIEVGGALGAPTQTEDGTLWVPLPARGTVTAIRGGVPAPPVTVAPPGHRIQVVLVGGRPVVLDATGATVIPIGRDHSGPAIPLPSRPSPPGANGLVPATLSAGPMLAIVDEATGHLLLVDLAAGKVDDIALPTSAPADTTGPTAASSGGASARPPSAAGLPDIDRPTARGGTATGAGAGRSSAVDAPGVPRRLGPPVWHDGRVYVPDQAARTVWMFDTRIHGFRDPIPVPATGAAAAAAAAAAQPRIAVTVSDDQVWINDATGPNAILVTAAGRITVTKQPAGLPGQSGGAAARPLPPAPTQLPERAAAPRGGGGAGPAAPSADRARPQRSPTGLRTPGGTTPVPPVPSPVAQTPPPVPLTEPPTRTPEPRPTTSEPQPPPTTSPVVVPTALSRVARSG